MAVILSEEGKQLLLYKIYWVTQKILSFQLDLFMTFNPCPDAFPSRFSCTSFTATFVVCFPHYIHSLGTFQLVYDAGGKDVVGVIIKCDSACGQEEQDKQVQCFLCHLILLRIIFLSVVEFEQLSATTHEYHTNDHMMEENRRSSSVRQSTFKVRPTGPLSIGSGPSDLFPLKGYRYSQT